MRRPRAFLLGFLFGEKSDSFEFAMIPGLLGLQKVRGIRIICAIGWPLSKGRRVARNRNLMKGR
jgi:hypothetical protein